MSFTFFQQEHDHKIQKSWFNSNGWCRNKKFLLETAEKISWWQSLIYLLKGIRSQFFHANLQVVRLKKFQLSNKTATDQQDIFRPTCSGNDVFLRLNSSLRTLKTHRNLLKRVFDQCHSISGGNTSGTPKPTDQFFVILHESSKNVKIFRNL